MRRQNACILTFFIAFLFVLVVIVPATVVTYKKHHKQDKDFYPLDVSLKATKTSDTEVLVTITNTGEYDVNLFARGSLLDPNPVVHKINIIAEDGSKPKFIGVHPRVSRHNLSEHSFHPVPSKSSVKFKVDISDYYDVSNGGTFHVCSEGKIPYAELGATKLVGAGVFASNKVTLNVTEGKRKPSWMSQKTVLQADCVEDQYRSTEDANAMCALISTVAGYHALLGDSAQFERYFKTTDQLTRQLVSRRFFAIAGECSGSSRVSTTFCSDQMSLCQSDYIAVTLGTKITNCEIFWNFPTTTNECHGYDKATTVIHEISHVDGVFDPSTDDVEYGWPKITYLSAEQAARNADTYQYYANAVAVGNGC